MSYIYISNLDDMPGHVRVLGVSHLVSIIQPEFQPDTPHQIAVDRHLRVGVHDVTSAAPGSVLAAERHVADLIDFVHAWPAQTPLLVHCFAGISRSTAAALVIHVIKGGAPAASARLLRRQAPHAQPNRHLIALADAMLGLDGELSAAVEAMAPAVSPRFGVGPLTELPLAAG